MNAKQSLILRIVLTLCVRHSGFAQEAQGPYLRIGRTPDAMTSTLDGMKCRVLLLT
jgi:hypothetical protein